jgi:hypothetical protein
MGKTKFLSAFEQGIVVGGGHTGLSVSRTATLLGFSHSTASRVHQEIIHHPNYMQIQIQINFIIPGST